MNQRDPPSPALVTPDIALELALAAVRARRRQIAEALFVLHLEAAVLTALERRRADPTYFR